MVYAETAFRQEIKYIAVLTKLWYGFQYNRDGAKHNDDQQADIKQSSGTGVSLEDYFVQSFLPHNKDSWEYKYK